MYIKEKDVEEILEQFGVIKRTFIFSLFKINVFLCCFKILIEKCSCIAALLS